MQTSAQELANIVDGQVEGNPEVLIDRFSRIEEADEGSLSFLANAKYERYVYQTTASALLVSTDFQPRRAVRSTLIRVEDVYRSLKQLLELFGQENGAPRGIAETAFIHPDAGVGRETAIGAFSVVEAGAVIGDHCIIYPQVFIGPDVRIGNNVRIYPGVRILHRCVIGDNCILHANAVIGSEGFGFARDEAGHYGKIPQTGNVVLENDVEIGACTTIDRAMMGSTLIRRGVKLDNLIQIGHNAEVGENTAIAAQAGLAGSTRIGRNCMVGGQVGFAGHLKVADGTMIQAQSGIASDVKKPHQALFGYPAIPYNDYIRSYAVFKQLPALYKRLHELEKRLRAFEEQE